MDLCLFEVRKKPSGTPFSVFLRDGGAPKRRGARENSPLDGPASERSVILLVAGLDVNNDVDVCNAFDINAHWTHPTPTRRNYFVALASAV